jgi:cellulose synthase/poly-beta-1,6-N-acetylglucosamine synthase-like glycosyltransferase
MSDKEIKTNYKPKYSIILPTYNESENLPYMLWLINKHLNKAYGAQRSSTLFVASI